MPSVHAGKRIVLASFRSCSKAVVCGPEKSVLLVQNAPPPNYPRPAVNSTTAGRFLFAANTLKTRHLRLFFCLDLDRCVLSIYDGKFHKSRYVPFGEGLRKRLLDYKTRAGIGKDGDAPFFSPPRGGYYSNATMQRHFRKLLWKAGISFGGRGKGPRMHDFRHTFAVRRLLKWSEEDRDLNALYPYLSAYLGHEDFRSTQYYLRLTVDAFPSIERKMRRLSGQIIPSVDTWEVQDADN